MEELFRFSVVRAVTKSSPNTLALATSQNDRQGKTTTGSAFQSSIQALVQQLTGATIANEDIRGRLEPGAAKYVVANGPGIVANALWNNLASLLAALNALAVETPASSDRSSDRASDFLPIPEFDGGSGNTVSSSIIRSFPRFTDRAKRWPFSVDEDSRQRRRICSRAVARFRPDLDGDRQLLGSLCDRY
jgi:hypothetical protein